MIGFLQRLKQRKIVQWAIAYVAFSFALLQALDLVAQHFDWPGATDRYAILVLAVGFCVLLLLAWYHGERGVQRVGSMEIMLLALLLAIGGVLIWRFGPAATRHRLARVAQVVHASTAAPAPAAAPPAASPLSHQPIPAKSVAVLPFENLSTDKANAYFADGMQDLILTKLADIGDLKVISRTSTEQYGSHPGNLRKIARELGVATILEGSVQKAGKQVLINVQLINAKTDSHIWAKSYTRTLDNIFGVEGEVAEKVAQALNAKLSTSETAAIAKIPTHNKVAYQAFLKANYYLNNSNLTGNAGELAKSITLTKKAVVADPNFADAWALLALAYTKFGNHNQDAEKAALRALAIDPHNAYAHTEYALALMHHKEFRKAISQAQEGVRLRPKGYSNHAALGFVYLGAGRLDEASAAFARAVQLDPRINFARKQLAYIAVMQRRYVTARNELQYAVDHDPADVIAAAGLAAVYELGWGDMAAARKVLHGVPAPVASSGTLSDAWFWLDLYARDDAAALTVIQHAPASWFKQQGHPLALYQAQVYRAQGDHSRAKRAFAQARAVLAARIKATPNDPALHANLALALAGLGDGNDAASEARRSVKLAEPLSGNQRLANRAVVEAWTGRAGAALKLLNELLSKPAGNVISVSLLKLDPAWDPIRHDPAFQALLNKYAMATSANAQSASGSITRTKGKR